MYNNVAINTPSYFVICAVLASIMASWNSNQKIFTLADIILIILKIMNLTYALIIIQNPILS